MRKFSKNLLIVAFVISALFHVISGVVVYLKNTAPKPKSVEVVFLDKKEFEKQSAKIPQMNAKQVVDQSEKRINDEKDEKAKYLSRYDQKVLRETKAATSGKFQNEAKQGLAPKSEIEKLTQKQKVPKVAQRSNETKKADKMETGDMGLPRLAALKPQFQWDKIKSGVQNPGPVSQTDDHLKDVAVGAETLLSSREFVYYSYYSRIKERLRVFWEPKIKEKVNRIFAAGRKIASDEDRVTKLIIVLDRTGKIIKVQVLGESGLKDLDDAAVEAFQAAAPFPNPPQGIVESDGTIKIRWDFIIESQAGLLNPPPAPDKFARN